VSKYYIAVVGSSTCDNKTAALAEAVGAAIARRGAVLVCGGRGGVMEAASRGAATQGGMVLGVLPGDDPRQGNRYLSAAVATGLGDARNAVISCTADAIIAVSGEYGTLSEIALGLKMGKPVIGLHTWRLQPPREISAEIVYAATPAEAVDLAWRLIACKRS
jgi:uncharacterized protein (TIGR00725 family)